MDIEKGAGPKSLSQGTHTQRLMLDAFYGIINIVILTPVSISFTSIIFSHPIFAPHLPGLAKLVLFSCAVHQLSFTVFSTLPFAVGQVQDAGLIFLSAMAYDMVTGMLEKGHPEDEIVSTVVCVLSTSTFFLGIALIIVGKLKLAQIVQYIPVPVIGGYLAYIGFFCGRAGIAMMTTSKHNNESVIENLINPESFYLWAPGVTLGILMYFALRNFQSTYVLPLFMAVTLTLFYGTLYLNNISFTEAREMDLIAPLTQARPFYEAWRVYDFNKVHWIQLPYQCFRWLGMFIVVAFSSSLDVAAIEMELNSPLEYNQELKTVGISNVLSGLTGGFTGSYIFSQTIFNMKRNVSTRACGYVIFVCELIVTALPISPTSYIPKAFFGSFLTLIAVDLMYEWLWIAKEKLTVTEYTVCLLTFFAIQIFGVEGGLVVGTLLSVVAFVFAYAESTSVQPSFKVSTVVRPVKEQIYLNDNKGKIMTLSLQGHIFFGSAVKLLEEMKKKVLFSHDKLKYIHGNNNLMESDVTTDTTSIYGFNTSGDSGVGMLSLSPEWGAKARNKRKQSQNKSSSDNLLDTPNKYKGYQSLVSHSGSDDALHMRMESSTSASNSTSKEKGKNGSAKYAPLAIPSTDSLTFIEPKVTSTEFLVLDFQYVFGVDATAIRSCFSMLVQLMRTANVVVVFTNLSHHIEDRLRVNGVLNESDVVIPYLDDALEWCEEQVLERGSMERGYKGRLSPDFTKTYASQRGIDHNNRAGASTNSSPIKTSYTLSPSPLKKTPPREHSYYVNAASKRKHLVESSYDDLAFLDTQNRTDPNLDSGDTKSLQTILKDSDFRKKIEFVAKKTDHRGTPPRRSKSGESGRRHSENDPSFDLMSESSSLDKILELETLRKYFTFEIIPENAILFDINTDASNMFFIQEGEIELVRIYGNADDLEVIRAHKVRSGGMLGALEFCLESEYKVRAVAIRTSFIWTLSKESYDTMETQDIKLYTHMQRLFMRNIGLSQEHKDDFETL